MSSLHSGCSDNISEIALSLVPKTWILWVILGLIFIGLCAIIISLGKKEWKRFEKSLRDIADAFNLKYRHHKPDDPHDYFAWDIAGRLDNRLIKIETIRTGSGKYRQGLYVISISCRIPKDLRVKIGYNSFFPSNSFSKGERPARTLPHLHRMINSSLYDNNIYASCNKDFDPEIISAMEIGQVLISSDMREAGIIIEGCLLKFFYDRRPAEHNRNIEFIRRVIYATISFAGFVEERYENEMELSGEIASETMNSPESKEEKEEAAFTQLGTRTEIKEII
jgi:hypothetical protein